MTSDQIILPEYLESALGIIMAEHPEYATAQGSRGQCGIATDLLLFKCDELNDWEPVDGYMTADDRPHCWAVVEGVNVDLTARQFDPAADFPKIWKP